MSVFTLVAFPTANDSDRYCDFHSECTQSECVLTSEVTGLLVNEG